MLRNIVILSALTLLLVVAGCGGANISQVDGPTDGGINQHLNVPVNPAPSGADEDFGFSDTDSKAASAAYQYFFQDTVNANSWARWDVENLNGKKYWILSNVFYTDPKAWQMGGNYWNAEIDTLTSHAGTVPAGRRGIKLGYHGRWKIAEGDSCMLQFSKDGQQWSDLAFFSGGQNPSYPNWDRYTFSLPDCGQTDEQYQVRFYFTSNNTITDLGYGVDRVAIYQTKLLPPLNVLASEENSDGVDVTWDWNFNSERPEAYDIYRAGSPGGPYIPVGSVDYPYRDYLENPTPNTTWWYVVKARKQGWVDSDFSNEDSGSWFQGD